jgi:sugar (pentulose or hexulose) kinase
VHPIIAWFDPRGSQEFERLDTTVRGEFCGRTGLPRSPLATIAKLAWMRGQGTDLAGHTWLSVPEYVAYRLTGTLAAEYSLAARTGLLDQDTSMAWPAAVQALGADIQILPALVSAGTPLGRVARCAGTVPEALVGAVVTVAGHDHPVAAVGSGAVGPDVAFDSFGTAQVLLRTTPQELDYPSRERLALLGINTVHHVMGNRRILVAGTRSGLLLRRTLNLLGITDQAGREALDAAAMAESADPSGIDVSGARNDDGTLRITVGTDTSSPAGLWLAVLAHGTQEVDSLLDAMEAEVGPFAETVVAGGWTRMRSVRRAKEKALPAVRFANRGQAPCSRRTPPRWPNNCPPPETPPSMRSITPAVRAMSSPHNSPTNPERKETPDVQVNETGARRSQPRRLHRRRIQRTQSGDGSTDDPGRP